MFDRLKSLFSPKTAEPSQAPSPELAVAALLIEAARADEQYTDSEKALVEAALCEQFALSKEDAAALRQKAEAAQAEAMDLHQFTKVAKNMPASEKIALVERLWIIVLSDGTRDPHEDTLVRSVCGLIYVSDPESGAARQRAQAALSSRR
ncbi:MAG TPA: TerB family tellurite resistance protein [Parvularculaceae bacterium]|nr:TerB family tellurite resistance protein [Caulobacterales bacterium]HOP19538.1 TerB family tellurite resistance protein [Amphiplicatus sp.]HPE30034.1 TerB family tellurite resistance protein [Parvularculaceae bacterium]HRX40646.1 TerB family tellurite resistance protein [Parvularculaceae bacterium]